MGEIIKKMKMKVRAERLLFLWDFLRRGWILMGKRLLIIGAGGHGKVVKDCCKFDGKW